MRDERRPTPQSSHGIPGGQPIGMGSGRQGTQHHAHPHAPQPGPPPTTLPSYHHLTSVQRQSPTTPAAPTPISYLSRPGAGRPPDGLPFPTLPRLTSEASSPTTPRFPSPTAYSSSLDKTTQYAELSKLLQTTDPHVVRQAIRDNHERCLVGSDYHSSFLVRR